MNQPSRTRFIILTVMLLLAIVAAVYFSTPFHGFNGATIMIDDHDFSDSAFGWMIAIPVMIFVGLVVTAVLAGAVLIASVAVAFAAFVVAIIMLLAFAPIVIFLAIPMLALYGFFKLIQRDRRAMASAS